MSPTDRLREHPHDRLAAPVQVADLNTAASELRAEPHDAVAGHRQIALVREGPVTVILFVFEAEGHLREHQTDGEVTIHVLKGTLQVEVGDETHQLRGGQLLALAPSIRHSVQATVPSEMLLTVHRRPKPA